MPKAPRQTQARVTTQTYLGRCIPATPPAPPGGGCDVGMLEPRWGGMLEVCVCCDERNPNASIPCCCERQDGRTRAVEPSSRDHIPDIAGTSTSRPFPQRPSVCALSGPGSTMLTWLEGGVLWCWVKGECPAYPVWETFCSLGLDVSICWVTEMQRIWFQHRIFFS
jgi:hypothetical protein